MYGYFIDEESRDDRSSSHDKFYIDQSSQDSLSRKNESGNSSKSSNNDVQFSTAFSDYKTFKKSIPVKHINNASLETYYTKTNNRNSDVDAHQKTKYDLTKIDQTKIYLKSSEGFYVATHKEEHEEDVTSLNEIDIDGQQKSKNDLTKTSQSKVYVESLDGYYVAIHKDRIKCLNQNTNRKDILYLCNVCHDKFNTQNKLQKHKCHTYMCTICKFRDKKLFRVMGHIENCHNKDGIHQFRQKEVRSFVMKLPVKNTVSKRDRRFDVNDENKSNNKEEIRERKTNFERFMSLVCPNCPSYKCMDTEMKKCDICESQLSWHCTKCNILSKSYCVAYEHVQNNCITLSGLKCPTLKNIKNRTKLWSGKMLAVKSYSPI